MIKGHANLDVLDNCDSHPVQSVCVCVCVFFFLAYFSVFSENILVKIQLILLMSLEIFAKNFISLNWKKEKRKNPSYSAVKCKSQGVLMQFLIFTFLPSSIFTSLFKVACPINQILLPLSEGCMDKPSYKSHRLRYRRQ